MMTAATLAKVRLPLMTRRSQEVLQRGRKLKEALDKPGLSADTRRELVDDGIGLVADLADLIARDINACEIYVVGDRSSRRGSRCYAAHLGSSGRGLERIETQASTSYFPYGRSHIRAIPEEAREKAVRELLDDLPKLFETTGGVIAL